MLFENPITGLMEDYPFGKEAAIDHGSDRYIVADHCESEQCHDIKYRTTSGRVHGCRVRYTINDRCTECLKWDQAALRNFFTENQSCWNLDNWTASVFSGKPHKMPSDELTMLILELQTLDRPFTIPEKSCDKKHHPRALVGKECYLCKKEREKPSPRQAAMNAGEQWYMPDKPCDKCGEKALKRVNNGQCQGCTSVKPRQGVSARQMAVKASEQWYIPNEECETCHTLSPKRTSNSECANCTGVKPRSPWIISATPCSACGEVGKHHYVSGACFSCGLGGYDNV